MDSLYCVNYKRSLGDLEKQLTAMFVGVFRDRNRAFEMRDSIEGASIFSLQSGSVGSLST